MEKADEVLVKNMRRSKQARGKKEGGLLQIFNCFLFFLILKNGKWDRDAERAGFSSLLWVQGAHKPPWGPLGQKGRSCLLRIVIGFLRRPQVPPG